ncbi:MAG: ABC transporter permease [Alphaproteobacteria bacterium]|nr:ABC transporter permease [Alphaproteobacteria bacterium]
MKPAEAEDAPPSSAHVDFEALPAVRGGSTFGTEWWIAMSHLRSKKSETFLSATTLLSILGVTAGVAMLNWVIAVMTGFEDDLRDKILGANAHVVVFRFGGNVIDLDPTMEKIDAVDGVVASAPFVYTEMMLRSPWSGTGVILKGVDPERTGAVTHLVADLSEGYDPSHTHLVQYADGDLATRREVLLHLGDPFPPMGLDNAPLPDTPDEPSLPGIVIGTELRDHLQVRPGDKVQIVNPLGSGTGPMGMPTPSVRSVRIAGVFDSGMFEYDTKWTYVTNALAQDFLKVGDTATGIEVKVDDIDDVERIARDIEGALGYPNYARHWKNLNAKLFAALELEKWVMGLLLNMIVVNAGLLIVTTLIMVVITKGREIAILKAMGASSGTIMRIFVMEGSAIGLVGTVLGTIGGLAGCAFLDRYEYPLETDVYYLDTLPVVVDPKAVAVIAVGAFVICFLCTIYPAWRASRLDPVEALRYE